jgi:hypothetical protein
MKYLTKQIDFCNPTDKRSKLRKYNPNNIGTSLVLFHVNEVGGEMIG